MKTFSRRAFLKITALTGAAAALTACSTDIDDLLYWYNTEEGIDDIPVQLYGTVTDAGEVVSSMVIDLGSHATVSGVDVDTFTVHAVNELGDIIEGTDIISYGDYDIDRKIVAARAEGSKIIIEFDRSEGATLCYASSARNYPGDLTYTITQNKPIEVVSTHLLGNIVSASATVTGTYTCDSSVIDEETAKFESVLVPGGINYQIYAPKGAKKLVVWFHGNGEGDMLNSNNNVAQIRANRGAVAWATDEVQAILGGAAVIAFQAPSTWYYAQNDGLLDKAANEINAVIADKGIDPTKVLVSGCSAGGYMTTRMLIAHPELFAAAIINCPALNVADARGGETPTDAELAKVKTCGVPVWLVQGVTDSVVTTAECSQRLFNTLTAGAKLTETRVKQADPNNSDFVTYETADGTYKLSLYDTTADNKLRFAEDYDLDGVTTEVQYSNHWSWIYSLNNNPQDAKGVHVINWGASYIQ
jgi:poly(3-hydroxybutyrate) depolymerase